MDIRIKIKPQEIRVDKLTGSALNTVQRRYHSTLIYTVSGYGYNLMTRDNKFIIAYNAQKVRTKRKAIYHKSGKNKGKIKEYEVVRRAHWIIRVYNIPVGLPIRVLQNNRFFRIISV